MLERDDQGHVRVATLDDPWQPDFASLNEEEARAYVDAELRYLLIERGRNLWLEAANTQLDGRSPDQALADGDYEAVWLLANGLRDPHMG